MHGGVLGTDQFPVEYFSHRCLDRRRGRKCKFASKSNRSGAPGNCLNLATEHNVSDCRIHSSKFWARCNDVVAIPEVVRCSNAWVDFSALELPVRSNDRCQKSDHWHRPRNAWMPRSKPSAVGFNFPDQAANHEFDVYRLRSFATAAGRIVNRGDYFRVRQRIHPTESEQLEHLRGPIRTTSTENSSKVAISTSNSTTYPPSTIEYRPIVYYAKNNCDAADDDETVTEDNEEDFSDEKTKLLADHDRQTSYFSWIRNRSRSGGEERGSRSWLSSWGDDGEPPSTIVPDNDVEQCRVTSVVRVVVLGDRGVGKTTLARQLLTSEHLANHSGSFNFTQGTRTVIAITIHTIMRHAWHGDASVVLRLSQMILQKF